MEPKEVVSVVARLDVGKAARRSRHGDRGKNEAANAEGDRHFFASRRFRLGEVALDVLGNAVKRQDYDGGPKSCCLMRAQSPAPSAASGSTR